MLYQKLRPSKFSDMVGQDFTAQALKNQIKNNKIAHSYLMSGTRGTGKTTSARILAKAVNCLNPIDGEPCGQCEMCKKIQNTTCVDIVELDAASNNGVDDIRRIIEDVKYPPTEAKYKVFIIDECHMLTQGAVNAFLKTLEEPPSYAIFILATTDPQKLPITIISRCQRFEFKRISVDIILNRLKEISSTENIKIDDKSLLLIAKTADGAMRDALSILEQVMSLDTGSGIAYENVLNMLGIAINDNLFKMSQEILNKNELNALMLLNTLEIEGKDLNLFHKDLTKHFRNLLISKINPQNAKLLISAGEEDIEKMIQGVQTVSANDIIKHIEILQEAEMDMKYASSTSRKTILELAIIKMCKKSAITLESIYSLLTNQQNNVPNQQNQPNAQTRRNIYAEAKKHIVEVLYQKQQYIQLANAIKTSKMTLKDENTIILKADNPQNKAILAQGIKIIINGFSRSLNKNIIVNMI